MKAAFAPGVGDALIAAKLAHLVRLLRSFPGFAGTQPLPREEDRL
jgi:hypothetical protein